MDIECKACATRVLPPIPVRPLDDTRDLWFTELICPECGRLYLIPLEETETIYERDRTAVRTANSVSID
jgi:hypothetical protein